MRTTGALEVHHPEPLAGGLGDVRCTGVLWLRLAGSRGAYTYCGRHRGDHCRRCSARAPCGASSRSTWRTAARCRRSTAPPPARSSSFKVRRARGHAGGYHLLPVPPRPLRVQGLRRRPRPHRPVPDPGEAGATAEEIATPFDATARVNFYVLNAGVAQAAVPARWPTSVAWSWCSTARASAPPAAAMRPRRPM